MTFREAKKDFERDTLPGVVAKYGKSDKPAMGQAWVAYVDGLHRDNVISDRQAHEWDNPYNP